MFGSDRVEVQDSGGEGHLPEEVGDLPCDPQTEFVEPVSAVGLEREADVSEHEQCRARHEAQAEEPVQVPELDAEGHRKAEHGGQYHEVDADRYSVLPEVQFEGHQSVDQDGQREEDGGPGVDAELVAIDRPTECHTVEGVAEDEGQDAESVRGGLFVGKLFEDVGVFEVRVRGCPGAVGIAEEEVPEPAVGQRRDDELHDAVREPAAGEFQESVRAGRQFACVRPGERHVDAVPDEHRERDAVGKEHR